MSSNTNGRILSEPYRRGRGTSFFMKELKLIEKKEKNLTEILVTPSRVVRYSTESTRHDFGNFHLFKFGLVYVWSMNKRHK